MRQIREDTPELYTVMNVVKKTNGVEVFLFVTSHKRRRMVISMAEMQQIKEFFFLSQKQ